MSTQENPFGQVLVAMVTPMNAEGEVDRPSTDALMAGLVDKGVDGIGATGATCETSTLTDKEKLRLETVGKQVSAGRPKIITGGCSNETAHAIRS